MTKEMSIINVRFKVEARQYSLAAQVSLEGGKEGGGELSYERESEWEGERQRERESQTREEKKSDLVVSMRVCE
jgi:hypothetical protein